MPARRAGRLVRKSTADTARNANLPALFDGADRHHSTKSDCRPRRGCSGRIAWHARADARTARALGFVQRHAVDDHLSPSVSLAKPIALGKAQSLGRYDARAGASRETDQRETAKLFSVAARGQWDNSR